MQQVQVRDLGSIGFKEAWDYQESLLQGIVAVKLANREMEKPLPTDNFLLFCEHPHVYTLGKSGKEQHLLIDARQRLEKGASFFKINRGGDITYHGPGQVVAYPVLDLDNFFNDIHRYLRSLEEVVIRTLADFGLQGMRIDKVTGVWIRQPAGPPAKICAFGVRCSRWVTMHGLALNVNTDLSYFDHIVPCGIADKAVTSMERELGVRIAMQEVKAGLLRHFTEVFGAALQVARPATA